MCVPTPLVDFRNGARASRDVDDVSALSGEPLSPAICASRPTPSFPPGPAHLRIIPSPLPSPPSPAPQVIGVGHNLDGSSDTPTPGNPMAVTAVGELFNDTLRGTWGVGVSVDLEGNTSGETSTPPPALACRRVDVRAEPGATNESRTSTR